MYLKFFDFSEEPFSITPNPRFLFLSKSHEEAIEALLYGITQRKGFISLSGDVGTGKTTICRTVLSKLNGSIDTSLILNPMLSVQELLEAINDDFGNHSAPNDTIKKQLDALNRFLLERLKNKKNAVVFVDEAQNLSIEALEMVRMLSNLETEDQKLLQIVLIGQPEMDKMLKKRELRQLDQRISIRCNLRPLSYHEMCRYVLHRIYVAGGGGNVQFEEKALKNIYNFTTGIPRLVNITCDRALLQAFALKDRFISENVMKKAISEVGGPDNELYDSGIKSVGKRIYRWLFA